MNFTGPLCEPSWALPAALVALGLLAAALILVIFLPTDGRICIEGAGRGDPDDPMAHPFGDQPRMPS